MELNDFHRAIYTGYFICCDVAGANATLISMLDTNANPGIITPKYPADATILIRPTPRNAFRNSIS